MTATYETSLRLKEAGIDIETQLHWLVYPSFPNSPRLIFTTAMGQVTRKGNILCPAPTFDELWVLLPTIKKYGNELEPEIIRRKFVGYSKGKLSPTPIEVMDGNYAEAAAQLLLWCKENNYL